MDFNIRSLSIFRAGNLNGLCVVVVRVIVRVRVWMLRLGLCAIFVRVYIRSPPLAESTSKLLTDLHWHSQYSLCSWPYTRTHAHTHSHMQCTRGGNLLVPQD